MDKPTFETMRDELLAYDPSGDDVRLSDWEMGFLDSVRTQRRRDFTGDAIPWSGSQVADMQQIWEKVFG